MTLNKLIQPQVHVLWTYQDLSRTYQGPIKKTYTWVVWNDLGTGDGVIDT